MKGLTELENFSKANEPVEEQKTYTLDEVMTEMSSMIEKLSESIGKIAVLSAEQKNDEVEEIENNTETENNSETDNTDSEETKNEEEDI